MMFPVRYKIPLRFGKIMTFFGDGTVHLLETAVVLEGELPRINVPFFLTSFHELFCGHTARTVPYATIAQYNPPSLLHANHLLLFWMPNGSKRIKHAVGFRLKEHAMRKDFASRIREGMDTAKGFERRSIP